MKKVLVTGASGFIGKHLTRELIQSTNESAEYEYDVRICARRIVDQDTIDFWLGSNNYQSKELIMYPINLINSVRVQEMMNAFKPDIIFHLAANPNIKPNENRPTDIIQSNITTTQNICHLAPEGCRVVFASSVVVYGDTQHKCREDHECNPCSVYAATKLASEGIVHAYHMQDRIIGTSLRLCATVGSGLTHGIVYDFINKIQSDNKVLEVLGDEPGTCKPFTHVDDVVQAFKLMIELEGTNSKYNVVPDDSITVKEVAYAVMGGLGCIKPIRWLGEESRWRGDNNVLNTNNQRLKYRGWEPKYPTSHCAIVRAVEQIDGQTK
jgi:UDP-glucose 4-epimerase